MAAALWGIAFGLGVAFLARAAGFDRDRSFYPVVLIVIAFYFVLFAVISGDWTAILTQAIVALGFCGIAIIGHRSAIVIAAAGIAGHGVYDFAYGALGLEHGAPTWWPVFCGVIDVILGAAAVLSLRSVRSQKSSAA